MIAKFRKQLLVTIFHVASTLTNVAHAQVQGESRLALLIGNAAYKSSPLKNPVNDVRLIIGEWL